MLLLFFAVYILIQIPSVQTWLVQQVTEKLTETFQTNVSVRKVNIDFFKTAVLEDIFIEDHQSDTLLFAKKIKTDIGIFALFRKEIFINQIQLEGVVANLVKKQNDSLFNYQFIIDAFSSDKPKVEKDTASSWAFGIGKVLIKDTRFRMSNKNIDGFDLKATVGDLLIDAKEIDFKNHKIALSDLQLQETSVEYSLSKNDQISVPDSSAMTFPAIGWEITADELSLNDNRFSYYNLNFERQADVVDYHFLDFKNIALKINDIIIRDTSINANIQKVSLLDHSGFQLKNLSAGAGMNNKEITLEKLQIETPKTSLKSDIRLSFNDFGDLGQFMEKVNLEATFESSQVAYQDLTQLVPSLQNIPVLNTNIDEKVLINGNIILEKNKIVFNNFDSEIGKALSLKATGSISQLTNDPIFDLDIKKLTTNYTSITYLTKKLNLPESLTEFGKINFSGQIKGTISDLNGKQLELVTDVATQFTGDLYIRGLPDIEKTFFKAKVENLTTRSGDLQGFSKTPFPALLDSLGLVKFKGDFEGTFYEFAVNGDFQTDAGGLRADLNMDFEKDYQNAKYEGSLGITEFDLSKILIGPFGLTSFNIETKGSGLNINDLDLTIAGTIPTFNYKDYTYRDLSLNGAFLKKRFDGNAKAEDENIRFDFQGMVDLNDSLPDFELALNVDTINLKSLNLYQNDLGFSGNLEADIKGNRLDNINGIANIQNFKIAQDSIHYSTDKIISLEARSPVFDQRMLKFRSEFMDANFVGKFNFADLPASIVDFVNGFFPIDDLVLADSSSQKSAPVKDQDVTFDLNFKDIASVAQLFLPNFSEADTAFIKGNFNSVAKQLNINGSFPKLTYGDFKVDTLRISSSGTPRHFETTISMEQAQSGDLVNLPHLAFHTLFANDTLNFDLNILGDALTEQTPNGLFGDTTFLDTVDKKLDLKGNISNKNDTYTLSFLPEFVLNNQLWKIAAENKIEFYNQDLTIKQLNFLKEEQEIAINSRGSSPENDFKPIEISLSNFNLEEISDLLGMTEDQFGGRVQGELILIEPKTNLHYTSEILIDDLSYNEKIIGDLDIKAKLASTEQIVELAVNLEGQSKMSINGNYEIKEKIFDLDFQFGRLPLFMIDFFMKDVLKDSEGYLTGDMKLKGSPDRPDVQGAVKLSDFNTTVVISNSRYSAGETNIQITENAIDLGTIQLKDVNDNSAVLGGRILHNYFQDIIFDLKFNTDDFQFLQTTVAENELYYGDLFLKAAVNVKGTPELPIISIDATTLPKSHLYVQPFSGEETVQQENYIIYANPEFYNEDSLLMVEQRIVGTRSTYDLSLKLQVTKDATLNIIIDPLTGDQLISVGSANLTLNINPSGVILVTGNYTIERGSYSLNYEQLVKRDFEIDKGSSIIFSGDPMNAAFDVTAIYKVRASTYELLASQSTLSDAEKQAASLRTDVFVLLKLKGNIKDPKISFDIQVPDFQGEGVGSALNRKLADLRKNPDELNKQAFGLLLFKSFIAESSSSSQTFSDAGTAIALSSVSSLLSDQLNHFADRYIKGFEVNIGVESYKTSGTQSANITQMKLSVSKQLFNERLTVNVGTNVNLGSETTNSVYNSNYSGIAGDFVLEYKLTESGNYLVKVFHKNDYNALEQKNAFKTGAGFIFRKSFNGKNYKE